LELISTILGAVKTVLGDITSSMQRIRKISTAFGEVLIEEMGPVGTFLLTDGEISASRDSLKYCTKAFLRKYRDVLNGRAINGREYGEFESTVKKFFDFAF
jgi:hypothetical protein